MSSIHTNTVYHERALLVGVQPNGESARPEELLEELRQLVRTAGAQVVGSVTQRRDDIHPSFYVGRGKAEEIAAAVLEHEVDVVVFDNDLSPAQIRSLEKACNKKVIDRTELILDIFATHAKTREAKLQVELAQLDYTLPRLRHMWTHLERLAGGVGIGTRGPGEKQIEVDRRIARKRITDLKRDLKNIVDRRQREVAARAENFTLALVGYTNAGKSTLMNALTGAGVLTEDKLFSTLDTKTHTWRLRTGQKVLLSDTVGFIRNLPHHLVASFHATLEEVTQATLLLHVVDASHPEMDKQVAAVRSVLDSIGCDQKASILVLNKVDAFDDPTDLHIVRKQYPEAVLVSARSREGLDGLESAVQRFLESRTRLVDVLCPVAEGRVPAYLAEMAHTLARTVEGDRLRIRARISARALERLWKETGCEPSQVQVREVGTAEPIPRAE